MATIAFTGRERFVLLRHVGLNVSNINHSAQLLLGARWYIWFNCNLMQAFRANYTSRCVFGTVGRLQVVVGVWNAAGRAHQESRAYRFELST